MRKPPLFLAAVAAATALLAAPLVSAQPVGETLYVADLDALNESGVEGQAVLRRQGNRLTVEVVATGLVPNQMHPQHIHGFDGGRNSVCPNEALTGDDEVLTLEEGAPAYGPVLLPLEPFPQGNVIRFQQTYTIDTSKLLPLEDRAIVLHGAFVGGDYVATLPVACGTILNLSAILPEAVVGAVPAPVQVPRR